MPKILRKVIVELARLWFLFFLFPNQYIAPAITQINIPLIGANGSNEELPATNELSGRTKMSVHTMAKG
jgi:hypothetical protein